MTTGYTYSGNSVIKEETATYTRYYTHGQGIDNVMAQDDGTSTNYYYKNHLGSTSVISNGTYTDDYDYTSWGEPVANATNFHNPYIYTGREAAENGLYYYRARFYDPGIGRFNSADPMGLGAGINHFAYTFNNPILLSDPSGSVPKGKALFGVCCRPVNIPGNPGFQHCYIAMKAGKQEKTWSLKGPAYMIGTGTSIKNWKEDVVSDSDCKWGTFCKEATENCIDAAHDSWPSRTAYFPFPPSFSEFYTCNSYASHIAFKCGIPFNPWISNKIIAPGWGKTYQAPDPYPTFGGDVGPGAGPLSGYRGTLPSLSTSPLSM